MTWKDDKHWSDQFLPEIKRILGEHLIGEPPVEEDAERNTDLIVLRMEAVRIGCRIRAAKFAGLYPDEFTIRSGRPSGVKTELTKLMEGWGDYFFYGFEGDEPGQLGRWFLGDMKVFRVWIFRCMVRNSGKLPGQEHFNRDNSSSFFSFCIAELPNEFVVARSVEVAPLREDLRETKSGQTSGYEWTDPPAVDHARSAEVSEQSEDTFGFMKRS